MATDFNNAPTDPDIYPPGAPLGPTIPYPPNAGAQVPPYMSPDPTVAYPGPIYTPPGRNLPPTQTQLPQWPVPGATIGSGATVGQQARPPAIAPAPYPLPPYQPPVPPRPAPARPPYQVPISAPAARQAKPTRRVPAISAPSSPYASPFGALSVRSWLRLPPAPHLMVGAGLLLMFLALSTPWGATSDGTLIYPQSFSIPYLSDNAPQLAGQLAQNLVSAAAAFSLLLVGVNYFLKLLNYLARAAGCAFTILLMPAIILVVVLLIGVDVGALIFGIFDPVASAPAWPWQSGFSLNGAHDELGYYLWYLGAVLNVAGGAMQPFVRRVRP